MPRRTLPGNAPCPCGSGKTYESCCYGKGFEWLESDDGTLYRSVPISEEIADALRKNREPSTVTPDGSLKPDDRLFSGLGPFEHLEHQMAEELKNAGMDPAVIYAFEKTGLLVSEENQHLIPDVQLAEWEAAIREYYSKSEASGPPKYPIGTVALYGPDQETTTKIAPSVILHEDTERFHEDYLSLMLVLLPTRLLHVLRDGLQNLLQGADNTVIPAGMLPAVPGVHDF